MMHLCIMLYTYWTPLYRRITHTKRTKKHDYKARQIPHTYKLQRHGMGRVTSGSCVVPGKRPWWADMTAGGRRYSPLVVGLPVPLRSVDWKTGWITVTGHVIKTNDSRH